MAGGNRRRAHHQLFRSRAWALHQPGRCCARQMPCTPVWQSTQQSTCTADSYTFHFHDRVSVLSDHCAASRMYADRHAYKADRARLTKEVAEDIGSMIFCPVLTVMGCSKQQAAHLPGSAMIWAPRDARMCPASAELTAAGTLPGEPAALQEPQPMLSRSI